MGCWVLTRWMRGRFRLWWVSMFERVSSLTYDTIRYDALYKVYYPSMMMITGRLVETWRARRRGGPWGFYSVAEHVK